MFYWCFEHLLVTLTTKGSADFTILLHDSVLVHNVGQYTLYTHRVSCYDICMFLPMFTKILIFCRLDPLQNPQSVDSSDTLGAAPGVPSVS